MADDPLDLLLRGTLDDFRLSRGERKVLSATIEQLGNNPQQLGQWRQRAFAIATESIVDPTARGVLEWLEEVVKAIQPKPDRTLPAEEVLFTPGDDCPRRISHLLQSAGRTADVCVFTITDDRISNALLAAHKRGVRVRIITDHNKTGDAGSDIDRLERDGINVRRSVSEYHMHHKFAVFDGSRALTGSYNWTRGAAEHNAENLVVSHNPQLVEQFCTQFEKMWIGLDPA